ncbi:MAG: cellulase family glycosylhydrolase [Bacilli bacterium]|nr:cellulase family glycosylhydrolase [Bacilli bacterium]
MEKIRGVNLGGWFVLEKWMKRDLFTGVSGPDETVFCLEKENPELALKVHWDSFITEADFKYLASIGINSVRIPIPWWLFGEVKPYYRSVEYIDKALDWANKYHLEVLLDLHTAPGCQNGFDNGGITGVIGWPTSQENIDLTVNILERIALRYHKHPALWGFEVLNEPHFSIDIKLIQDFYRKSYEVIRKHTNKTIVFHDSFRPEDASWKQFFEALDNVCFDLHLYHCFDEKIANGNIYEQIKTILARKNLISELSAFTKVIIGEWSLGLRENVFENLDDFNRNLVYKCLADVQLSVYETGFGWYFWSYKIDSSSFSAWDFARLIKAGILPDNYK